MIRRLLASAATAAALQLALAAPVLAAPPPIEAYGQLPALEEVEISPDGQKIAFIAMIGDKRALGVRNLATGQTMGGVDLGDQKVRDIEWAGNGHVLITTSKTTTIPFLSDKAEWPNVQSYNIETRTFATLMDETSGSSQGATRTNRGGTASLNVIAGGPYVRIVDGKPRVFVHGYTKDYEIELFEVDLDTGMGVLRKDGGHVMDAAGNAVARSEWYYRDGRWRLVARDGKAWKEIFVKTDANIDTPDLYGAGRTPDTVIVGVPEEDRNALYEISLKDGSKTRLSFGEHDAELARPFYDYTTGRLMGFRFAEAEGTQYVFLDKAEGAAWASILAGFKDRNMLRASWTPDFKKVVIRTDGANDSGTFLLVDVAAGKASKLGSAYPGVPGDAVNPVKVVHYKAADGFEVPAYLTLPRGKDAKNLPLVVLPHGGPQSRDTANFDYWTQALASRGYAVLQPQFRGSDGFGKAHLEAGYGEWGRKMQTDLSDGVRHLAKEGTIDPKRVCIFGWSYGGYAAMAGPTIDPGVYRCAVAGAGVSDLRKMLAWERDQTGGKDTPVMRYWKRFMGAERISDGSLDAVSPALQAEKADAPILLIHGKDDTVVPYQQSVFLADALKRAGKPYEFVTLDGEDHHLSKGKTRLEMLKAAIAFLEKHNPPN